MTTYLGSGDERTHDREYFPEWLRNLADDVTMEASVMNGIARGPQAVRDILGFARTLYDYQEFQGRVRRKRVRRGLRGAVRRRPADRQRRGGPA